MEARHLHGGSEVMTQAVLRLRHASQGLFLRLRRSRGFPKLLWITNLRGRPPGAAVAWPSPPMLIRGGAPRLLPPPALFPSFLLLLPPGAGRRGAERPRRGPETARRGGVEQASADGAVSESAKARAIEPTRSGKERREGKGGGGECHRGRGFRRPPSRCKAACGRLDLGLWSQLWPSRGFRRRRSLTRVVVVVGGSGGGGGEGTREVFYHGLLGTASSADEETGKGKGRLRARRRGGTSGRSPSSTARVRGCIHNRPRAQALHKKGAGCGRDASPPAHGCRLRRHRSGLVQLAPGSPRPVHGHEKRVMTSTNKVRRAGHACDTGEGGEGGGNPGQE